MKKRFRALLRYPAVLLFFGFLVCFSFADSLAANRKESALENRELAQKPVMTAKNLLAEEEKQKYSYLYEQYINDQFLGRDRWISLKSRVESLLLKAENNGILYGAGGSMYQKFFTLSPTADGNRTQLEANIDHVARFAGRHPGLVTVMVVPSASSVTLDRLPLAAPFVEEAPWMERMAAAFEPNAVFLDLTGTLRSHAGEGVFYLTDHHWTTAGAYYAYLAYLQTVGRPPLDRTALAAEGVEGFFGTHYSKCKLFSARPDTLVYYPQLNARMTVIQLLDPADREAAQQAYAAGQLTEAAYAQMADRECDLYDTEKLAGRDKYGMFLYGNNGFSRIEGSGEGKILILKDSYANCFVPFLLGNYRQIDVADLRSLKANVDELIANEEYDEILILYNFQSFSSDTNLALLNRGAG